MADQRTSGFAEALLSVARAEGIQAEVEDELFGFAAALRGNDQLRTTLADPGLAVGRRLAIVNDLLEGKARPVTTALVTMVVGAGRTAELPEIIDAAIDRGAATRNRGVARVRSAVELSEAQKNRLVTAIAAATGNQVEIKTIIDPAVIGGVVTEIGDDVIDGSLRLRLNQMRSSLS